MGAPVTGGVNSSPRRAPKNREQDSDYLRKISVKLLSMESKSQHPEGPGQINPSINQNPADPATLDSIAPTGHVAVADLQEGIYQQIRSLEDLYLADLND
ncbi:uncharacterized protein LOC122037322 isoform X3 [Zingiber officinale]|uniref:uncharacterized protein LOC122037322 isoform X3 n=1 Tax=Zingiber officinale TaxID=94328 RepID=UPI001C4C9815|nr:uncharacterized protein LOC122037322 isoform X3 [Zingiber officinale]